MFHAFAPQAQPSGPVKLGKGPTAEGGKRDDASKGANTSDSDRQEDQRGEESTSEGELLVDEVNLTDGEPIVDPALDRAFVLFLAPKPTVVPTTSPSAWLHVKESAAGKASAIHHAIVLDEDEKEASSLSSEANIIIVIDDSDEEDEASPGQSGAALNPPATTQPANFADDSETESEGEAAEQAELLIDQPTGGDLSVVDAILQIEKGRTAAEVDRVLVKWEDFDELTWEPLGNISRRLIQRFMDYEAAKKKCDYHIDEVLERRVIENGTTGVEATLYLIKWRDIPVVHWEVKTALPDRVVRWLENT